MPLPTLPTLPAADFEAIGPTCGTYRLEIAVRVRDQGLGRSGSGNISPMDDCVFTSSVHYREPKAALAWLERAFGFEVTMAIDGPPEAPEMCHYEMSCAGHGRVMVGGEWAEWTRSPASADGANTQSVHVQLPSGLDEHCERARAAGAVIVAEPEDQFFGDRTYRASDLEGHCWTFSTHLQSISRL